MKTPIIAIVSEIIKNPKDSAFSYDWHITNSAYIQAIEKAGGLTFLMLSDKEIERQISLCDGVLFQGGKDIDPSVYSQEKKAVCGSTDKEEDIYHLNILKEAIKQKKAILGICRGFQLINCYFGGSLYQDYKEDKNTIEHRRYDLMEEGSHIVSLVEDTHLYKIFNKKEIKVNSLHHQKIKDLGESLIATAIAEDGTIEAFEKENIIAVQWHPEALNKKDDLMMKLFKTFIKKAKKYS